jgi:XTP/dITP diphosphohydrolase
MGYQNTLAFVTGSDRKVGEARLACDPAGIEIIKTPLDIDEIQSDKPQDISIHKAKQAYAQLQKPLVVTDTFFAIPALNGFPGAYMKFVAEWFRPEDFILLLSDKADKTITFSESITYIDEHGTKIFSKEFHGRIVDMSRGTGNSIENVAEFDGVTLGERRTQGGFSHKPEDFVWTDFATWYNENTKVQ